MIMAKKLGMTRIYNNDGSASAVTVLQISSKVVGHKTQENDGYIANILAYGSKSKLKKPQQYIYDRFQVKGYLREDRVIDASKLIEVGAELSVENFALNQLVNVRGISKGKGFAGVMKRHNFKGGRASHGASLSHRTQGSTGSCQDPGKVWKGKKMAGHLGNVVVSVRKLRIIKIDLERNLLFLHGSVPGCTNRYVEVSINE